MIVKHKDILVEFQTKKGKEIKIKAIRTFDDDPNRKSTLKSKIEARKKRRITKNW